MVLTSVTQSKKSEIFGLNVADKYALGVIKILGFECNFQPFSAGLCLILYTPSFLFSNIDLRKKCPCKAVLRCGWEKKNNRKVLLVHNT